MRKGVFYLAVLFVVSYSVAPLLWQFLTSLKMDYELTRIPPLLPEAPSLAHYVAIFKGRMFLRIIANSAVVASCTTVLALAVGSLCSFGLARLGMSYKVLILGFVLSISMFPPIATVSPLYLMIRATGLRDTWLALIITYTTFSLPLSIWILTSFFRELPDEIYHASRIDGCTPFQSYCRIVVPLAAPGFFATAILVFIFSWNEFLYALTFTSTQASRTIPVAIALFPGLYEIPWGEIAAASVTVTAPLVVLVLVFQRRIIEGLTGGAVKG